MARGAPAREGPELGLRPKKMGSVGQRLTGDDSMSWQ
jgi:hypothetical protein